MAAQEIAPIHPTTGLTNLNINMPTFGDLPRELRDIVYDQYIFDFIEEYRTKPRSSSELTKAAPLLIVNKEVGREAAKAKSLQPLSRKSMY